MMVDYVEAEQAMAVLSRLGFHVRDQGLLLSALARPSAGMFGTDAYPSIEQKAAALLSSLSQNHTLFDGNKRLSLLLTFIFLELNGCELTFTDDEAFDLVLTAAQSEMTVDELATVIAAGIRVNA
ncbi:type II toxin-antitoxin system death-on-curing family toxin [Microbacterium esteraromaticum]|uniref:Type II toxin-antitoxin system death-on-curing family toxin n=2 Tax=Microbacterium esteraromaticum TaxID=57043 RepID=A0A939DUM5_9MICO|nr:type II toxin-antitoxin system death-on-curing family toxin [Microbacterium esteraromaticum]MBN8414771.1 type II toxin-antitoxin system death-on-curing family toxin [Microbacterium esteraromaticum]